jgi:ferrous iron transport protein A
VAEPVANGTSQLAGLRTGALASVVDVRDESPNDPVAARLRDLGFVAGEALRVISRAPFGGDPMVVAIGSTRFALRRREAARVIVESRAT